MTKILRVDLVFSYWVYIWYLLYVFHFTYYSPKFPLALGLLDNIIMLLMMITYKKTNWKTILNFITINMLIKVVPLYYLQNETIKSKDIYFTLGLFLLFIIWLHINSESLIGNMKDIHDSLLYNKNKTPFMALLDYIRVRYYETK